MARKFELENPAYLQDNPTGAYVLEQSSTNSKTVVPVPVVIGLTNDTFYEVLSGLTPGQVIVVGAQANG
jgi:multidrug efflux pump subunit AcrA (membrane-fusion protein)